MGGGAVYQNRPSVICISEKDGRTITLGNDINDVGYRVIGLAETDGQTALHLAISQQLVNTSYFFLNYDQGRYIGLADISGKTPLHYACSGPGESESSLAIMKMVLEKCDEEQINRQDNDGRTALHIAAIEGRPKCISILLKKEGVDVQRRDWFGKSPLHYAAANGCDREGFDCVEVLLNHKFKDEEVRVNFMFKDEDTAGDTPFSLACQNCPIKTVELFLSSSSDPRNWLSDKYIQMLYQKHPYLLKGLMDKSFSRDKGTFTSKDATETPILVDYGPIIGYSHQSQPETKFLIHSLEWRLETQSEILLHPLVQLFILKKSRKFVPLNVVWAIWETVWLISFGIVAISPYVDPYRSGGGALLSKYATAVMTIYVFISILTGASEFWPAGVLHGSFRRIPIIQATFAAMLIGAVNAGEEQVKWMKYPTAVGVLITYVISWERFKRMPYKIGEVIGLLTQVIRQTAEILFCCAPLLIGFTVTFIIISDQLNSFVPAFVNTIALMMGSADYKSIIIQQEIQDSCSSGNPAKTLARDGVNNIYHLIDLSLFLIFVISIPIALYCFITNLALENMTKLKAKVMVEHLANQVENIYFLENLIVGFNKIPFCWRYQNVNIGEVTLDQNPVFQTVFRERIKRPRTDFLKEKWGLHSALFKWCHVDIERYELGLTVDIVEKIEALLAREE